MKKYLVVALSLYTILGVSVASADQSAATGLIPGQIWYSTSPLVEGDTVKIHTAVWNGDTTPLQARVEFYDQSVILGTRDVTIAPQILEDVSVSWQVTAGDHLISAKIISSSVQSGTKTQSVTLERNETAADHTFVPVVIKTSEGTQTTATDSLKTELSKVGSQLASAVPDTLSSKATSVDSVRLTIAQNIAESKSNTQKSIDTLTSPPTSKTTTTSKSKTQVASNTTSQDGTQKPILYVKLFLLSVAGFIFGNKIVFYGLILFIVFLLIKYIYHRIKHR